jgi:hypothetical protein
MPAPLLPGIIGHINAVGWKSCSLKIPASFGKSRSSAPGRKPQTVDFSLQFAHLENMVRVGRAQRPAASQND